MPAWGSSSWGAKDGVGQSGGRKMVTVTQFQTGSERRCWMGRGEGARWVGQRMMLGIGDSHPVSGVRGRGGW